MANVLDAAPRRVDGRHADRPPRHEHRRDRRRSRAARSLQTDNENVVTASTDLALRRHDRNSGDSQEVQIPVTLTIEGTKGADRQDADRST